MLFGIENHHLNDFHGQVLSSMSHTSRNFRSHRCLTKIAFGLIFSGEGSDGSEVLAGHCPFVEFGWLSSTSEWKSTEVILRGLAWIIDDFGEVFFELIKLHLETDFFRFSGQEVIHILNPFNVEEKPPSLQLRHFEPTHSNISLIPYFASIVSIGMMFLHSLNIRWRNIQQSWKLSLNIDKLVLSHD